MFETMRGETVQIDGHYCSVMSSMERGGSAATAEVYRKRIIKGQVIPSAPAAESDTVIAGREVSQPWRIMNED